MQMTNTFEAERYGRELKLRIEDMPIGDPERGGPYGEYLKSKGLGMIIGVVASVVTMGAALPMMAAGASLASQIAGGVMFAGGALTGIGTVTGNKKLTKIGGVLSLAGGLGALGSSALTGAGVGGAFAPGSGSTALQNMAGGMMESVNNLGTSLGLGNSYDPSAVASATSAGGEASVVPLEGASTPGVEVSSVQAPAVEVKPLPGTENANLQMELPSATGGDSGGGILAKAGGQGVRVPQGGLGYQPSNAAGGAVNGGGTTAGAAAATSEKGLLSQASGWLKDNAELVKVTSSMVEKGIGAGMAPDQEEQLAALAARYNAETKMLKTQQEVLEYQKNNMSKQVAMVSADDPDRENKVKAAAGKGIPVVFIPAIGAGGVTQTGGAWNTGAANVAPQTPVRQATFGQQAA